MICVRYLLRYTLALLAFAGGLHAEERPALLIAAASDLKFALDEALVVFAREEPGIKVKVTFGSSGGLFAQMDNGAPFDLFLSADARFPVQLVERGKAEKESLFSYARGHLVLWVPKQSALDLSKNRLGALLDPSVRKVAIANPDVAPYGAAAVAALKSARIYDQVKPKLVLGENVVQASQFVESGAADAGIIALSLALAPRLRGAGRYWELPLDTFPALEQAGVIRSGTAQLEPARRMRAFLISDKGRQVFQRFGFILPDSPR